MDDKQKALEFYARQNPCLHCGFSPDDAKAALTSTEHEYGGKQNDISAIETILSLDVVRESITKADFEKGLAELKRLRDVQQYRYDISKAKYYVTEARRGCWNNETLNILLDDAIDALTIPTTLTSCWKDISTAPKDGTEVIGRIGGKSFAMAWQDKHRDGDPAGWCYASYTWGGVLYEGNNNLLDQPTHWMPLPTPPTADTPMMNEGEK